MNKESPFNHFSTGNLKTLSHPDIRNRLLNYYKKYYTSEIMHLCIYSNKPNEEMFKLVEGLFSLIPKLENFKMPRYDEVQPYDKNNLKYLYKVIPIKDANEIQLEWYLPYCDDYRSKPLSFLSEAIGHEGPNTLTSSLNKDNLCNSLVAGSSSYSKTYMRFYISISLTKKGLENYKEIILRCLKCIKDMQKIKINKRFYEETKDIRKMEFDYLEKLSPISSVRKYVANLIEYKPEDVISGILFGDFNEDLIKKYLDMLTLDNLNIFFISNLFEKECNLTEEIYGTKYCKEKLNITEEEINSYKCKYIFDYPPENDFIPKNFDLLPPPEKINKYPEKIPIICQKDPNCSNLPETDKTKYLVSKELTVAQFNCMIRNSLGVNEEESAFYLLVNMKYTITGDISLSEVYQKYKNPQDGFLYIIYTNFYISIF